VPFNNLQSPSDYLVRADPREPDVRGEFFRDQTAILHSLDFRRLKRKTQVFFDPDNDHICTRIEHVMHVSTIAATICKGLGLDADLAQAIGLGHDIGHAPFGHAGERVLDELLRDVGGFMHEIHGLRVVDHIAGAGNGLNLTWAVRDGIVSHCGERWEQGIEPDPEIKDLDALCGRTHYPSTWEGCVVRVSDKIAYLGRDIEDAIMARMVTVEELPGLLRETVGTTNGEIINSLVLDVIEASLGSGTIAFSDGKHELVSALRDFNYRHIYRAGPIAEYQRHCERILRALTDHLLGLYEHHGMDIEAYRRTSKDLDRWFGGYLAKLGPSYRRRGEEQGLRIVGDYVAGMTDDFALRCYEDLVLPRPIRFR